MALYGNLVFYPATDATLYALDARNGNIVWKNTRQTFHTEALPPKLGSNALLNMGWT